MSHTIKRTPLDISRLDCLKCGESVFSETKSGKEHLWKVFRYKDLYVYFPNKLDNCQDGSAVLGYELDKQNLENLFEGKKFESKHIKPIENL